SRPRRADAVTCPATDVRPRLPPVGQATAISPAIGRGQACGHVPVAGSSELNAWLRRPESVHTIAVGSIRPGAGSGDGELSTGCGNFVENSSKESSPCTGPSTPTPPRLTTF